MARLAGFEPATYGLEVRCSIQLSHRRVGWRNENYYSRVASRYIPVKKTPVKGGILWFS